MADYDGKRQTKDRAGHLYKEHCSSLVQGTVSPNKSPANCQASSTQGTAPEKPKKPSGGASFPAKTKTFKLLLEIYEGLKQ